MLRRAMMAANAAVGGSYLDALGSSPVCCIWITKKLISTATVAIRVRRSSDNTEQDIGFSGDALDTTALLAFVGAGNGYLTKIYDQTGNGYHAVQATTSKQPRVVNAGVFDGKGIWDAVDDGMKISTLPTNTATLWAFTRIKASVDFGGASSHYMLESSPSWLSNSGAVAFLASPSGSTYPTGIGANASRVDYTLGLSTEALIALHYDTTASVPISQMTVYKDGSAFSFTSSAGGTVPATLSAYDMNLGCRNQTGNYSDMNTHGFVFYTADVSAIRSSIEALL